MLCLEWRKIMVVMPSPVHNKMVRAADSCAVQSSSQAGWKLLLSSCRQGLCSMGADLALASAMLVYGLARSAEAKGKLEAAWKLQVTAVLDLCTTGGVGELGWTSRPSTSAAKCL